LKWSFGKSFLQKKHTVLAVTTTGIEQEKRPKTEVSGRSGMLILVERQAGQSGTSL